MNSGLKIYADFSKLEQNSLKNLNPIFAFHLAGRTLDEIRAGRSNPDSPLTVTNRAAEADWFVLPMNWSYYLWNQQANLPAALELSELAKKNQKQIIVWYKGDLIPLVPFDNAVLFLPGMRRSSSKANQRACPVFVDDPLPVYQPPGKPYREKSAKPSLGFCGYASINAVKFVWSIVRGLQLNAASRLGKYEYEGVPVVPATLTRARALNLLARHPQIDTRFIIRDKYYGNKIQTASPTGADAARAFYSNIFETDYTLCLRGYGNWSYRFYETLASGRIPVFIDTECVLPLDSSIDWKKYCVWVDQKELKHIGEKVADFHSALSPADFIERQIACRNLWEEHLTPRGFMNHFHEYL